MGLIPCTCGLSDLLCLSWNPNWQKQKSWAGFQSESVQACSLPADQTGSQVALHQCDGFIWLRNLINFYIALCSHISTEVFRMVKILNKNKPKRLALKWCVIPSRLALSQLTKHKRKLMLHLTNMQWVCLAVDIFINFYMVPWSHISTEVFQMVQNWKQENQKAFLLSDVWFFQDLLFPGWQSTIGNSCY